MAADRRRAERIMLPRRFPTHVIGRIVGYLIISGVSAGGVMLLFGEEPRRLASERINPLAFLPYVLVVVLALGLIPMLISLFRRPLVSADHYSLTVRPGILRTLVLPWARISQLAIYSVALRDDPEPLLLVRCAEWHSPLGDNPGWWDQRVWRAAAKSAGGAIGGYDVAVRLSEFSGEARAHLDAIGAFAPERVSVVDRTGAHDTQEPKGKKGNAAPKAARRGARGMPGEPGPGDGGPGGPERGALGGPEVGAAGHGVPADLGWRDHGEAERWQDDPTTDLQGPPRSRHGRFRSRRDPTSGPPATGMPPGAAPGLPPDGSPYGPAAPPGGAGPGPSGPADPAAQDPPTELLHLGGGHDEPAPSRGTRRGWRGARREPSADLGRRGRRGQPPEAATERFSPSAYLPPAEDFESDQFSPSAYLPPAEDFGPSDAEPTARFESPIGPPGSPAANHGLDEPPTEQISGDAGSPPGGGLPGWAPPNAPGPPAGPLSPPGPPSAPGPPGWGPPPHQPPPYEATPPGAPASGWSEAWPPENVQTDQTQALPPPGHAGQYHQARYPESPYGEPEPYDEPTQDRRPYPPPPGRH